MLLQFVLVGIGTGFIYVLFAIGLVLVHREARIVNFAHGGYAAVGAYIFTTYYGGGARPYAVAVLGAALTCAVLGWLSYRLAIGFLTDSDPLTMAMATLGILTVLVATILWAFGPVPRQVPSSFGGDGVTIGILVLTYHSIFVMVIGAAMCVGLTVALQRTPIGRSMRAVSEDRTIASLLGVPVRTYDQVTWAVAGALAGFAGVMVTPTTGVTTTALVFLLVKGFAAALIGRFESFGLVVAGGLTIGVMESLVIWKLQDIQGLREVLAFVIIASALFFRERERVVA